MFSAITFFVSIGLVLERWKRRIGRSDKELAFALGYASQADWSKAKHGTRPFDLHRFFAHTSRDEQVAFVDELQQALAGGQRTDRDLLREILSVLKGSPIKAELRSESVKEVA